MLFGSTFTVSAAAPPSELAGRQAALLEALANATPEAVSGYQATIAAGVITAFVAPKRMAVKGIRAHANVCGTAGQTDVKARKVAKNALVAAVVDVATVTIDNADADGISKETLVAFTNGVPPAAAILEPGDVLLLEVTTAATAGTGLAAAIELDDYLA